jgi:hypothetical protein
MDDSVIRSNRKHVGRCNVTGTDLTCLAASSRPLSGSLLDRIRTQACPEIIEPAKRARFLVETQAISLLAAATSPRLARGMLTVLAAFIPGGLTACCRSLP